MDALDELSYALADLSMFPYFDMAHYIISIMALKEQQGTMEVSRVSPLACWFSSMIVCFAGTVLAGIILAEPPLAPLAKGSHVLLASLVWYLMFYCPWNLMHKCVTMPPLRLVLSAMKEVTRTWKVLAGVSQARSKYKDGLLIMIATGYVKGAGGGLIINFQQLIRGAWKPDAKEFLKMGAATKVSMIGAVLFALQQSHYLPIQTRHLMLIYTVFTVLNKTRMICTGSATFPFDPIESVLHKTLFVGFSPYAALTAAATTNGSAGVPTEERHGPRTSVARAPVQTENMSEKKSN
nr:trimeric intracellular cation channel type B-like [Nerophis lumbriciformis]